jgi:hypothetical protein
MRDLIEESRKARARKATNGHPRDYEAETRTQTLNLATDLLGEIRNRHPGETKVEHLRRFFRAVEGTTNSDLYEMFFGTSGEYYLEVTIN